MASDAVQIEAGGRSVRVSSPTRVIYEATDFSPAETRLRSACNLLPSLIWVPHLGIAPAQLRLEL